MISDIDNLIKVQGADLRAEDLRKEIATLPVQVARIEKTLEAHKRKLEADQAVLAGNQKERRQLDGDVQMQQQKISKLRDQMLSAKTNEQYRAFQHEIEYCEQQIRKAEDRILELMLESESLEKNVKVAEGALKKEEQEVERQKAEARKRTEEDRRQLEELSEARKQLVAVIPKALMDTYVRLQKKYAGGGVIVADATDGRCSACQLELRPQLFQELRRGEKMLLCENCHRILHYNPPVDFDTAAGGPAAVDPREGTRVDMS
ncbi:MAG: hypothetical protein FJW20_21295 [Acidimicrobiia bacterium]|nr:hypothetical protein [Acidimicrobiia bacterium]